MTLLLKCVCGASAVDQYTMHGIPLLHCMTCGVIRQDVAMSMEELAEWYRTTYKVNATHTYAHDYQVAKKRLDAYQFNPGTKLLDIGSGNNAFVYAARDREIEAWGQDLGQHSECDFTYVGTLEEIAFPTDSFDVITIHDVLEHVPDPLAFLREVRRLLKRPGKLVIDFPAFHVPEGVHHWKPIEHLWMFTEGQLLDILLRAGFNGPMSGIRRPIPSKIVVEAERVSEKRPQIMVPPGIGDSYWVMAKLPGFLKTHGLGTPDIWVQHQRGPKRTLPYLRTIPFVHAAGYRDVPDKKGTLQVLDDAYWENGPTVFKDFMGCDYFIAYNGTLRWGRGMEEVDPEYGCDWHHKMFMSKEALDFQKRVSLAGPYIVTYWIEAGMYREWLADFSAEQIAASLRLIQKETGYRVVFMGAPWDLGQVGRKIAYMDDAWEDWIGVTSFDQMLGMLAGAQAVIGHPAGNTILATALKVPTVQLWNKYFHPGMWTGCCSPQAPYVALDTKDLSPQIVMRAMRSVLERGNASQSRPTAGTY